MDMIICGNCGWIGTGQQALQIGPDKIQVNPQLLGVIQMNHLTCKACANCGNTCLFTKSSPQFVQTPQAINQNVPIGIADSMGTPGVRIPPEVSNPTNNGYSQQEDEEDEALSDAIMDSIQLPKSCQDVGLWKPDYSEEQAVAALAGEELRLARELEKTPEPKRTKRAVAPRPPEPEEFPGREPCDTCHQPFTSKDPGMTRCPKCLGTS